MSVVPLIEEQIPTSSRMLARTFQNDALAIYMFPNPMERAKLLPVHFELLLRYALLAERVWTTTGNEGVVVCQPPGHLDMDMDSMTKSGMTREGERVGEDALNRFTSVVDHVAPLRPQHAGTRHWYVMALGVDPSKKGQGIGTVLMKHVFSLADADRVPCYLETAQPENVQFYRKNGFEVVAEGVEPASNLRFWTFKREPSPQ